MDLNDFQLKVLNSYFCDLKFIKNENDFSNCLYGIPIESAIRIIASRRANKKSNDKSLEEFLEIWKEEFKIAQKEVYNILNNEV